MKLLNYIRADEPRLGIKIDQGVIDVEQTAADCAMDVPTNMADIIIQGKDALRKLAELEQASKRIIGEDSLIFAPCITNPEKIICVGLNYTKHIEETKMTTPLFPVLFSKFNNALAAHKQKVILPRSAEQFDYEAELVVVIGKEASYITKEEALSCVFGYTIGNDLSARDLQFRTGQWLLGKTCDGFAPIGPYLVTADELDPNNLGIKCEVNGELRQSGHTSDMLFDCATIISYVSQYMTLKPGDIIFTGTPSGVIQGNLSDERGWLSPGDEIVISIEKIGTLKTILG